MNYHKYSFLIILFALFLILYTSNSRRSVIETYTSIADSIKDNISNVRPHPAIPNIQVNGNYIDTPLICESSSDPDVKYTMYRYNKLTVDGVKNNTQTNNSPEVIKKCMRVMLKDFKNKDNIYYNDPDDDMYALSVDNIEKLNACEFEGDKNPITNEECTSTIEMFYNKVNNVEKKYDIVNITYFAFLFILFSSISVSVFKKLTV